MKIMVKIQVRMLVHKRCSSNIRPHWYNHYRGIALWRIYMERSQVLLLASTGWLVPYLWPLDHSWPTWAAGEGDGGCKREELFPRGSQPATGHSHWARSSHLPVYTVHIIQSTVHLVQWPLSPGPLSFCMIVTWNHEAFNNFLGERYPGVFF